MRMFSWLALLSIVSTSLSGQDAAKTPAIPAARTLQLTGDFPSPLTLGESELAALPRHTLQQQNKLGPVTYEGVFLRDVLAKAGIQFGHGLTGKTMASYLLLSAADGYQIVFTLPEVDPDFANESILIADQRDGGPLTSAELPFQLVVPNDKLRARSMHAVTSIQLVRLRK